MLPIAPEFTLPENLEIKSSPLKAAVLRKNAAASKRGTRTALVKGSVKAKVDVKAKVANAKRAQPARKAAPSRSKNRRHVSTKKR